MEIVLIRHGKPEIDTPGKVSAFDFGKWIVAYDNSGIDASYKPETEAYERTGKCSFIVCSTLLRSTESADVLNIGTVDMISFLFRECEMPYANWHYPKFSVESWAILFRLLQLIGYSSNAESYHEIKERVVECVRKLEKLSREHKSVLFIGHATLLWFIHKQLIRMGWSGPRKSIRRHWEFGMYTK